MVMSADHNEVGTNGRSGIKEKSGRLSELAEAAGFGNVLGQHRFRPFQRFAARLEHRFAEDVIALEVGGFCDDRILKESKIDAMNQRDFVWAIEQTKLFHGGKRRIRPIDSSNDLHASLIGPYLAQRGDTCAARDCFAAVRYASTCASETCGKA